MRPYPGNIEDEAKLHFNYILSRSRRVVECAFGLLTMKRRCFQTELQITPDHAALVVKAVCLLHNICIERMDTVVFMDDTVSAATLIAPITHPKWRHR
ncbi:putative nuclease HARBI1-like protein [Anopheles sinensis]|uniref:DDE Tnp4 domain-containing protein n=1 Tax=Anopheles sinensis TaxID=74873 RepID=A0A084WAC0_ANOSI|nr:putative nuclease HARBI1-like protein [Anopheles sinensis]